jgi:hypothetical protein
MADFSWDNLGSFVSNPQNLEAMFGSGANLMNLVRQFSGGNAQGNAIRGMNQASDPQGVPNWQSFYQPMSDQMTKNVVQQAQQQAALQGRQVGGSDDSWVAQSLAPYYQQMQQQAMQNALNNQQFGQTTKMNALGQQAQLYQNQPQSSSNPFAPWSQLASNNNLQQMIQAWTKQMQAPSVQSTPGASYQPATPGGGTVNTGTNTAPFQMNQSVANWSPDVGGGGFAPNDTYGMGGGGGDYTNFDFGSL